MERKLTRELVELLIRSHIESIRDIAKAYDPKFDYMSICINDDYFHFYNDAWKGNRPVIDYYEQIEEKKND